MIRYAAFLRGINVGGNKKVPMEQLKSVLEGMGFSSVTTLLASVNVIFTASEENETQMAKNISANA